MIDFLIVLMFLGTIINLLLMVTLTKMSINIYEMMKAWTLWVKLIPPSRLPPSPGLVDLPEKQLPYHLPQP